MLKIMFPLSSMICRRHCHHSTISKQWIVVWTTAIQYHRTIHWKYHIISRYYTISIPTMTTNRYNHHHNDNVQQPQQQIQYYITQLQQLVSIPKHTIYYSSILQYYKPTSIQFHITTTTNNDDSHTTTTIIPNTTATNSTTTTVASQNNQHHSPIILPSLMEHIHQQFTTRAASTASTTTTEIESDNDIESISSSNHNSNNHHRPSIFVHDDYDTSMKIISSILNNDHENNLSNFIIHVLRNTNKTDTTTSANNSRHHPQRQRGFHNQRRYNQSSFTRIPQRRNQYDTTTTATTITTTTISTLIHLMFQLYERIYTEFAILDMIQYQYHTNTIPSINTTKEEEELYTMIIQQIQQYDNYHIYRSYFTNIQHFNRLLNLWKELSIHYMTKRPTTTNTNTKLVNEPLQSQQDESNVLQSIIMKNHSSLKHTNKMTTTTTAIRPIRDVLYQMIYMMKVTQELCPINYNTTSNPTTTTTTSKPKQNVLFDTMFHYDIGTISILLQVLILQLPSKYHAPYDVYHFIQSMQHHVLSWDIQHNIQLLYHHHHNNSNTMTSVIRHDASTNSMIHHHDNNNINNTHASIATSTIPIKKIQQQYHRYLQKILSPDIYMYNMLMKVWIDSGRSETSQQLQLLFQQMRGISSKQHDTHTTTTFPNYRWNNNNYIKYHFHPLPMKPNAIIYTTLLRFYGSKGMVDEVNTLLYTMEHIDHISPTLSCYAQVIYGYTTNMSHMSEAGRILDTMISIRYGQSKYPNEIHDIAFTKETTACILSSASNILHGYRRQIDTYGITGSSLSPDNFRIQTESIIRHAEMIVRKVQGIGLFILDDQYGDRIRGIMMDIYARANHIHQVQAMFDEMIHPDAIAYHILIKAYRKNHRADLADQAFQLLLHDPHIPYVSIQLFNSLIYAWADSTLPSAIECGMNVFRLIKKINRHNKLNYSIATKEYRNADAKQTDKQYNYNNDDDGLYHVPEIHINTDTYNALLKCFADGGDGKTFPMDCGKKIEGLIQQMEQRHNGDVGTADPNIQLTSISYITAIRACLRISDLSCAESILRRMEISCHPSPDVTIYNTILDMYSKFCHTSYMKVSNTIDNDTNTISDMMKCNTQAANRASRILHYMIHSDEVNEQPNMISYNRVLQCWTKSFDVTAVDRMWDIYEGYMRKMAADSETTLMNSACYDTMISFFTSPKSNIETIRKAEQLLHSLEVSTTTSDAKPEGWYYSAIIKGYIHLNDLNSASLVLIRAANRQYQYHQSINTISSLLEKIITTWIALDQLETAILYIVKFIHVHEQNVTNISSNTVMNESLSEQWNEIMSLVQMLQAAVTTSNHPQKDHFLSILDQNIKTIHSLISVTSRMSSDNLLSLLPDPSQDVLPSPHFADNKQQQSVSNAPNLWRLPSAMSPN